LAHAGLGDTSAAHQLREAGRFHRSLLLLQAELAQLFVAEQRHRHEPRGRCSLAAQT
jgi:hypothetical protein